MLICGLAKECNSMSASSYLNTTINLTLENQLRHVAQQNPEFPAVWDLDHPPICFDKLLKLFAHIRRLGQKAGLRQNDRVAIYLQRPADMAVWIAALSNGLVVIPLLKEISTDQLHQIFQTLKPRALINDLEVHDSADQIAEEVSISVLKVAAEPWPDPVWRMEGRVAEPNESGWLEAMPYQVALILMTSGSTQSPKLIPVMHRAIGETIAASASMLSLQSGERCLNVMPLNHVHGLISGVYLPWIAGGCSVIPGAFNATSFLDWLEQAQPNWFSTSPAIFAEILRRARTNQTSLNQSSLRFVRCGSAVLSPSLALEIEDAFQVPLLEAYGMSETLQITGVPFGEMRPGSVGKSLLLDIGIFDHQGRQCSAGRSGEIRLRGPSVLPHYLAGAAPKESFVGDWFCTGDAGYLDSEGFLYITGRLKEMINRGGENIAPAEIEACILKHPAVEECVVYANFHPTLGETIAAAVVFHEDEKAGIDALRQYFLKHLPTHKIPTSIHVLDSLPRSANGKVNRKLIVELANPQRESTAGTEITGKLESWLAGKFKEILNISSVYAESDFFALGGSSLNSMQLLLSIQEQLDVSIHMPLLLESPTLRELAQTLSERYPSAVARLTGVDIPAAKQVEMTVVNEKMHQEFEQLIPSLGRLDAKPYKNDLISPVFILSAPRCGSTLLRVMLAGHPGIFAPPELRLLTYQDMNQWKLAHSGKFKFFREGLIRAVMTAFDWTLPQTNYWLEEISQQQLPVEEVYTLLQHAIDQRLLVDKTPLYALDINIIESTRTRFFRPRYIVLNRNPVEMKRSYTEAHMDQIWMYPLSNKPGDLAELIWYRCFSNIDRFINSEQASRCLSINFEDLVSQPKQVASRICKFLNINFDPSMLDPYDNRKIRMTEGAETGSPMIGDPGFFQHSAINIDRAGLGFEVPSEASVGEPVRKLARKMGYGTGNTESQLSRLTPLSDEQILQRQRQLIHNWEGYRHYENSLILGKNIDGNSHPIFWCFQGENEFLATANGLGPDQPIFAMRSGHLLFDKLDNSLKVLARAYADNITQIYPDESLVLGGNCQGAHVARQITIEMIQRGQPPSLIFLMEADFDEPLSVPAVMIYGKESRRHNPYLHEPDPEKRWSELYPEYSVHEIPGIHGQYFTPENLPNLLEVLRAETMAIHKKVKFH